MATTKKVYRSFTKSGSVTTGTHQPRGGLKGKAVESDSSATGKTPKRYDMQMRAHWGSRFEDMQETLHEDLKRRGLAI